MLVCDIHHFIVLSVLLDQVQLDSNNEASPCYPYLPRAYPPVPVPDAPDLSTSAIDEVRAHPDYHRFAVEEGRCVAAVCDLTSDELPDACTGADLDIVLLLVQRLCRLLAHRLPAT